MHHSPKNIVLYSGSILFLKQVCLVAMKYVFHVAVLVEITDILKSKVTDLVYFSLIYNESPYVSILSQ